jgi:hypothetical protein
VPGSFRPIYPGHSRCQPPRPDQDVVALVRAGSARHQKPLVVGGHERSRPACHNPRSQHIHSQDQGGRGIEAPGSNPTSSSDLCHSGSDTTFAERQVEKDADKQVANQPNGNGES